jgi:hypothetical protein
LHTLLYRRACDIRRHYNSGRADPILQARTGQAGEEGDALPAIPQATPSAEPAGGAERLTAGFARMREVLDRIAWPAGRQVDSFAVWLLLLRLRVGACFAVALGEQVTESGELADRVAGWLPWHDAESVRRFRQEWPVLERCWQTVRDLFDSRELSAATVVDALAGLVGGAITLSLWNQWTHRARAAARERLQPGEWEGLFARWIRDR